MRLLHNIGISPSNAAHIRANYNTREEVQNCQDSLSFDGIYRNVWENRDIIQGRNAIMFVMGNYIGKDNSFDTGMPLEHYCNMDELYDLQNDGHILAWHTWSHPDLTAIPLEEARREMTAPSLFRTDFAYPYGRFNDNLRKIAKELGYKRAWSVTQGDDNNFSLRRDYV